MKRSMLSLNDRVMVDGQPGKVVDFTDTGEPMIALATGFMRGVPQVFSDRQIKKVRA